MIRPVAIIPAMLLAFLATAAASAQPPAEADRPAIAWEADAGGRVGAVRLGLPAAAVASIRGADRAADRLGSILAVEVADAGPGRPAILGDYAIEAGGVRFTPRYPLRPGVRYRATFRPDAIPGGAGGLEGFSTVHSNARPGRPPTRLVRVDPAGDTLPANLLKFYLHFSAPMARGEAYEHIRLRGEDGRPLARPFLELGEELWDPTGTRLTVLLDPGRIKRGLRPREELGPILEAGRSYTFEVDAGWPDAEGSPLAEAGRKAFRAGPDDADQPDPRRWEVAAPRAGTKGPIRLAFPEPLDRALLESAIAVVDDRGAAVDGSIVVDPDQRGLGFEPAADWAEGEYRVEVGPELEDLAGNGVGRPFEVDVQPDVPARPARADAGAVRLPVRISTGTAGRE